MKNAKIGILVDNCREVYIKSTENSDEISAKIR